MKFQAIVVINQHESYEHKFHGIKLDKKQTAPNTKWNSRVVHLKMQVILVFIVTKRRAVP